MKTLKLLLALISLTTLSTQMSFAQAQVTEDAEFYEEAELETPKYKMKEIREYVKTLPTQTTCMDEYVKRRNQLITQVALAPLTIPASFYAGGLGGIVAGSISYTLLYNALGVWTDPSYGWKQLGYMIAGGVIGAGVGVVSAVAYTTKGSLDLVDNQRLLKALMEAHHNEIGPVTTFLHTKYKKKHPESTITVEDYSNYLLEHDRGGNLCNGSIKRKKAKFRPNRLSKRLSSSKDIAHFIQ
jgi:hypothetical protein